MWVIPPFRVGDLQLTHGKEALFPVTTGAGQATRLSVEQLKHSPLVQIGQAHRRQQLMAEKSQKRRPNNKAGALSDVRSRNVLEANRTLGYAQSQLTTQSPSAQATLLRDARGCSTLVITTRP